MLATQDQAAVMEQGSAFLNEKMKMKVIASELRDEKIADEILMKFEVEYISGDRTAKMSPQISVTPGSEATVTIGKTQAPG